MEMIKLIPLIRRWWWLLLAGALLGLAGGFFASTIQTPVYEASTKVLVSRGRQQGGADVLFIGDQQLLLTYVQLLKTRPILDQARSRLGIDVRSDMLQVNALADTQIIQIKVQGEDAAQTAAIANTLVQILIEQNETLYAGRYAAYEEGLNTQIAQVQDEMTGLQSQITQINQASVQEQLDTVNQQIEDIQAQILTLENDIAAFPSLLSTIARASLLQKQNQLDQLRSSLALYQEIQTNLTILRRATTAGSGREDPQVDTLRSTLNLYEKLYLDLLNNLSTAKLARVQSTPTVSQIDEAVVPDRPIRPVPLLYMAVSALAGLLVAAIAILILNFFDDTLKSSQDVQDALGVPVIGQIATTINRKKSRENPYWLNDPGSPLANSFGFLRINVNRLLGQKSHKAILITSPALGDGKTTIAINLAMTYVRAGQQVVLIDADFHHPQIHFQLGLENDKGLSNILAEGLDWQEVVRDFGGVSVITSGSYSPPFTAVLESERMTQLLRALSKKGDLVIVDGPPLFIEDSQILASKTSGTLLVFRQGSTINAKARAMLDQLKLIDANVLGIVLNRVPGAETYYFDGGNRNIRAEAAPRKVEPNLEQVEDSPE
jgi:capsular exopolysaccharide synthesis family protein